MIITKIIRHKKQKNSYAVYVDEAFAFYLSDDVVLKFGLLTGKRIDEKTVELIASAEALDRAKKIALNFLSYRPRSSKEVIDRLRRKGFATDLAKKVVQHFQSLHMMDDTEFARMYIRDKLKGKPMGKVLMRHHLLEKGVAPQIIERALREYISEEEQQEAASQLAAKRLRLSGERLAKLDPARRRKRLTDYLLRRGFSSEVASKAVSSLPTLSIQ